MEIRNRILRRFTFALGLCYLWTCFVNVLLRDDVKKVNKPTTELSIDDLKRIIRRLNEEQTIYNEDIYGPVQPDTLIVAIQVHNRLEYLRHVISSLSFARHIDEVLLVFSHDYYDDRINDLIRSINFTKVLQIFYPYSVQIYPDQFPGNDSLDCSRIVQNGSRLDSSALWYKRKKGYCRDSVAVQIKHHWWWKANWIFNQLECTANHNEISNFHTRLEISPYPYLSAPSGLVLFLEDDHYMVEDFVHVLRLLQTSATALCPRCEVLCLGTGIQASRYRIESNRALIKTWSRTMNNMGFALNRTIWEKITRHRHRFCSYNDYNWDLSLLKLSRTRKNGPITVMLSRAPRVFHIGKCGVHVRNRNCSAAKILYRLNYLLTRVKNNLYPPTVDVAMQRKLSMCKLLPNGGWNDRRDHELCTNMTRIGRRGGENTKIALG